VTKTLKVIDPMLVGIPQRMCFR